MVKKGFTFIEVVISLVIIGIMASVASLIVSGWFKKSRDAKRLGDMNIISSSLENYYFKNKEYPYPSEYIKINYSGSNIGYQGALKEDLVNKLSLKTTPEDPLSKQSYTYSINKNKDKFQLLSFLEEKQRVSYKTSRKSFAKSLNYKKMDPYVKGNTIGTFLILDNNEPIEKYFSGVYETDIKTYNTGFNVIFKNNFSVSGSGKNLLTKVENFRDNISKTDKRLNLFFPLDEGIGEKVSGYSYNLLSGSFNGEIKWSEGIDGKGLLKDLGNGKIIVNHNTGISLTGESSISLWIKPLEVPDKKVNIIKKSNNYGLNFKSNSNIQGYLNSTTLTGNIDIHRWNHIVLNYSDGNLNLFKNAKNIKSKTFSGLSDNNDKMYLLSGNYKGVLDELRIYKGSISGNTINAIYKSYK